MLNDFGCAIPHGWREADAWALTDRKSPRRSKYLPGTAFRCEGVGSTERSKTLKRRTALLGRPVPKHHPNTQSGIPMQLEVALVVDAEAVAELVEAVDVFFA